ncbi:MAG: hypothetical protein LBP69_09850 [Treponema sp.]|jgi:predicted transcriptional regulator|nr:hypothetical protein [Treponema sp.]
MSKRKVTDSIIPLSLRLNPAEHFQLKELARYHRRSMNEEAVYLIEEAAKDMRLKLDIDDDEFKAWIAKAAKAVGVAEDVYLEKLKRDYEKRHENVAYFGSPDITLEEIIRQKETYAIIGSDMEIQDGILALAEDIKRHRRSIGKSAAGRNPKWSDNIDGGEGNRQRQAGG